MESGQERQFLDRLSANGVSTPQTLKMPIDSIILDGALSTVGMGNKGDFCNTFDSVNGSSSCPVGIQLNWNDSDTNSCSAKITKSVATCGGSQTYRGPAANAGANNCDNKTTAPTVCAGNEVVKGFDSSGNPFCGAPL